MKRILTWSLSLSCVLALLAGCAGQGGGTDKPSSAPENTPAVTPSAAPETEESRWYELDGETGILTVRIPDETPKFEWHFVIGDEEVLELLAQETTEGTYVASFRALADGKSQITFRYVKNDALNELRLLEVSCKDGKVAEVTLDNVMELPGMGEDDPEIAALRETNSLRNVLKEHTAVTCVSETWDGENHWQYKTVTQFTLNGGRLWYDHEQYDESDRVTYCEAGYINDDVPGALYLAETGGDRYMEIYPSAEYETFLAKQWLRRLPGDYERFADSQTDTEYNNTTLTARRANDLTGVSADVLYFTDSATGLIHGMEVTEYSGEDPARAVSVTRSNVMYDEPRLMEEKATLGILFPEDACYLNVVIHPGQADEEELSYQVAKSTRVEFVAQEDYALFFDYACEQPMEWIDVGQNKLTVYAVLR